ncbi:MAG: DUF624 domain-containing protein [Lachnospiraceae bacterium]|nr:DUF624 domain-containing protein [Lachnospiraceae bacterium]
MPGKIFDFDGPVAGFIFLVRDLFLINLLTLVFMLPVFTIGPALKALAFTCLKIVRKEDGNVFATYIKNFKLNFKQSVAFGLVCLVLFLIMAGDIAALVIYWKTFSMLMIVPLIIVLFMLFATLIYAIPMQGRFLNPVAVTFRNAFWAALYKFPKTVVMVLAFLILPCLYYLVSGNFFPLLIMFGLSLPAYLNAVIYEPFFKETEDRILARQRAENGSTESLEHEYGDPADDAEKKADI